MGVEELKVSISNVIKEAAFQSECGSIVIPESILEEWIDELDSMTFSGVATWFDKEVDERAMNGKTGRFVCSVRPATIVELLSIRPFADPWKNGLSYYMLIDSLANQKDASRDFITFLESDLNLLYKSFPFGEKLALTLPKYLHWVSGNLYMVESSHLEKIVDLIHDHWSQVLAAFDHKHTAQE